MMKKIWQVFYSMQCGIVILGYLVIVSMIATFLPGGESLFRSWVFVIPACGLGINLFLCSVKRFPELLARMKQKFSLPEDPELLLAKRVGTESFVALPLSVRGNVHTPEMVFGQLQVRLREKRAMNQTVWSYGFRYRFGIWGSWICHLGMLLLLIGVVLGQFLIQSTYVYGVPGQTKEINGTGMTVAIDAFVEELRTDGTVEQYQSIVTILNHKTGERICDQIRVNEPLHAFGMDFLQSGSGRAVTMDVYQGLTKVASGLLCEGEIIGMAEGGLQLKLEEQEAENGDAVQCSFYYNGELFETRTVKIDEPTVQDSYQFVFTDPQKYTLLQIVSDPTEGFVLFGALLVLTGAWIAFSFRPQEIWVKEEAGRITVYAGCFRDGGRFAYQVREKLRTRPMG